MNKIEKIKKYVQKECRKPKNKFDYEYFLFHLSPMVKYADQISDRLGGDKEVVLTAAWLHDIGKIIHGHTDHHITGAKIAETKLKELNYSEEKIKLIKKCIFNHRGTLKMKRESIEEQIIADADYASSFENITGLFKTAYLRNKLTQSEARVFIKQKLERKWNQLQLEYSKKIIKSKYKAAMLLLE